MVVPALLACVAPVPLLSTSDIDPGPECAAGGVRVATGIDQDRDGVLDPEEEDAVSYICNGTDGRDGQDGGPEIGEVVEGDYVIENSMDAALLDGVREITGNLLVNPSTVFSPYGAGGLETLVLPDLTTVRGSVWVTAHVTLRHLELPALETIGGELRLDSNYALEDLSASALRSMGNLYVSGNHTLTTLGDIPELTSVQTVYVQSNALLEDLPAFESTTDILQVWIYYNPALRVVSGFRAVEAATGGVYLVGNDALVEIDGFDALTTTSLLAISNNASLESVLGFDALTAAGNVEVRANASLGCLDADVYERFARSTSSFVVDVAPCAR